MQESGVTIATQREACGDAVSAPIPRKDAQYLTSTPLEVVVKKRGYDKATRGGKGAASSHD